MGNCINKQEISDESSISSIEEIRSENSFKSKKSKWLDYFNMDFPSKVLKSSKTKKTISFNLMHILSKYKIQ